MTPPTPTAFLQVGPFPRQPAAPPDRTSYRSVLIPNDRWYHSVGIRAVQDGDFSKNGRSTALQNRCIVASGLAWS
jgi:hypothetical protein